MLRLIRGIFGSRGAPEAQAPTVSPTGPAEAAAAIRQGNECLAADQYEAALAHYQRAQACDPACLNAYVCQAYACRALGRPVQARGLLRHVLAHEAGHADAHYMLGNLEREAGDFHGANRHLRTALHTNPRLLPAYLELAQVLYRLQQMSEAGRTVAQGLSYFPQDASLLLFRGNLLVLAGAMAAAADSYRQAVQYQDDFGAAWMGLGTCLCRLGDFGQAIDCMRRGLSLEPNNAAWHSDLLFAMQYRRESDTAALFQMHLDYSNRFERPLLERPRSSMANRMLPARLKIGYVSGDFRAHALAYFIEPVLRLHDRDKVEVYCYYTYPVEDGVTERLRQAADHWRSCADMTDDAMASTIVADGIDILVDLAGHTAYNRLLVFARKPAPIQMTWLGYQFTTGLKSIDYRITDRGLDPDGAENLHSEKLLLLRGNSGVFQPDAESPLVNDLPCLTEGLFTFGCLNNTAKMSPEFLEAAAHVLLAAPHSRLLLGGMAGESESRICTSMAAHGIGRDRLVLVPPLGTADYLRLHHRIDLALDTFPYNGGTTTMHSLWMGVPILALEGDASISRVGACAMRGLQLPEFACNDRITYIEHAVAWTHRLPMLQKIRSGLRARMHEVLVGQAQDLVTELENAFSDAFAKGLRPPGSPS